MTDRPLSSAVHLIVRLGHHFEQRPDREGNARQAIIFELEISADGSSTEASPPPTFTERELKSRSLEELRRLALQRPPRAAPTSVRRQIVRLRNAAVRLYVLRRALGVCEACGNPAPFVRRNGQPYLEPHHVNRIADGGPDHPHFVAPVCPTCHRRVHHGIDGEAYNREMAQRILALEMAN